jgi:transaldolase/glucose-6-phosphate isomerase
MDLKEFHQHGQSIWLDYIRRELLETGEFERLVREDDIRGVTTNPSIFEKAIAESTDYDNSLRHDVQTKDEPAGAIYERLVIEDIQRAADILRPTFDASDGQDGFVSMEVSPYLAHDTQGTIAEARRLWARVARPNVMIKVPGTREGFPAIEQLTAEGVNVNVTLLFGREACRRVHEAYMAGLEARVARSKPIERIASVASMFVSRIDVLVGKMIESRLATVGESERARLQSLSGKVGIANAKLAYQDWKQDQRSARWQALAAHRARPQRLLWASTSTKDKRLSDVLYVEALLGPDTVDTIPPATLAAMRDHGHAEEHLEEGLDDARQVMDTLAQTGISIDEVTDELVEDGIKKFAASFDELMSSVERKRDRVLRCALDRMSYALPPALQIEVDAVLEDWRTTGKVRRLWARDASLWTGADEAKWLDWLDLAGSGRVDVDAVEGFAREVRDHGFTHAVVLGMGGSSLCPEVLARTFGSQHGYPELIVLDSTDPQQIRAVESRVTLATTLFVVASKSGTTLEPNVLLDYFHARLREVAGDEAAGKAVHRDHRPRDTVAAARSRARVRARIRRPRRSRRPLLGVVEFRSGSGRAARARRPRIPRSGRDHGPVVRGIGAATRECRRAPRRDPRHRGPARPRQGHARRLAGDRAAGHLARAAARRIHRQARQGADADRRRGARATIRVRRGSHLRLPAPRSRVRPCAGHCARRDREGRPARRSHCRGRGVRSRRGALPLGDRRRGGRVDRRHRSVRSAGCRGQQAGGAVAARRIRAHRPSAR